MKDLVRKFSEKAVSKKGSFTLEVVLIIVLFVLVVAMSLGVLGDKVKKSVENVGTNIENQTACILRGGTWDPTKTPDASKCSIPAPGSGS